MRAETSLPPSFLSCILGALPAEGWPNDARSDFAFADKSLCKEFAVYFQVRIPMRTYWTKNPSIATLQDDADPHWTESITMDNIYTFAEQWHHEVQEKMPEATFI